MAITLISTPAYVKRVSPSVISRWLATESANNFRLQRKDFIVDSCSNASGYLSLSLNAGNEYTGTEGNNIIVYDATTGAVFAGTITNIVSTFILVTSIPWQSGFNITYLNDNTLRGGYYFEGRLTVNNVVQTLTVIASPDSFGLADIDVSGILKIMVTLGKTADYSTLIAKETTKSGKFTFEYREAWYGSDEAYTAEGNTWYYAEAIRSEEEGSNLYEFVPDEIADVKFLNLFDQPVFFPGLPFDLSFILPKLPVTSPVTQLTVTVKRYSSTNMLLGTSTTVVSLGSLEGFVNSLRIDPAIIEDNAAYLTVEIV